MDISHLKVKDLHALIEAAQKRIVEIKKTEEMDVRNKLIATAKELGYDAFQLLGKKSAGRPAADKPDRARKPAPIKYKNKTTGETWTGRGLQPKWLKAAIAAGKSLQSFEIA